MEFDEWMKQVDKILARMTGGLTSEDLADYDYQSAFEDGATPTQAAKSAYAYQEGNEDDD